MIAPGETPMKLREEMRIGGQNTVEKDPISGARRGATYDDPPPLMPSTRRGLYG